MSGSASIADPDRPLREPITESAIGFKEAYEMGEMIAMPAKLNLQWTALKRVVNRVLERVHTDPKLPHRSRCREGSISIYNDLPQVSGG